MTNQEKLEKWFDEEKERGLVDVRVCPGDVSQSSSETFCGSILGFVESRSQNKRVLITEL